MGKNYVEFKYGKGLVVLDVLDIKKYIPSDIWWEGIKRGKGVKRTNESYERKGNTRKQDPRIVKEGRNVGLSHAETYTCQGCGKEVRNPYHLNSNNEVCNGEYFTPEKEGDKH